MRIRCGVVAASVAAALVSSSAGAAPRLTAQPGDAIGVGTEGTCTLGFLFRGSDGATYASTAGHCALDDIEGDQRLTWAPGKGPVVSLRGNADGSSTATGRIGTVVFAEDVRSPSGDDFYDFAMIRLDKDVAARPQVRGVGGVSYVYEEQPDTMTFLDFYGQGDVVGGVQPQRQLVANRMTNPDHVYANGVAVFGDSGAPVVAGDGGAVGLILGAGGNSVGVGVGSVELGHDEAVNRIGRLTPVLGHASKATRVSFRLFAA